MTRTIQKSQRCRKEGGEKGSAAVLKLGLESNEAKNKCGVTNGQKKNKIRATKRWEKKRSNLYIQEVFLRRKKQME